MSPKISVVELSPEFKRLSVKQAFWLRTYCQTAIDLCSFDPVLATKNAYHTQGENARTFSYQILRNPKIQAALRVFLNFGKSKRGIFLDDLKAEIASRSGSAARERLLALYAEMAFGMKPKKKGASR